MDKTLPIDMLITLKEKGLTSQALDENDLEIKKLLAEQLAKFSPYGQIRSMIGSTATELISIENSVIYRELAVLKEENTSLKNKVIEMNKKLDELVEAIGTPKTIILRQLSRKEAKQEIKALFSSGETLYFSDIAERLSLDLETVVEICKELANKGEIEVDENTL